jgi:type II secretory pathway component GspD/PulD (secretin)
MDTRFRSFLKAFLCCSAVACSTAFAHDWKRVGGDQQISFYVDQQAVKRISTNEVAALTMLNYMTDSGQYESMLSGVVYDCTNMRKLDTFTTQYELHWAEGKVIKELGAETSWHIMPADSIGAAGARLSCTSPAS